MRIGRIPYINCYPVYGAIDRGIVTLDAELVDGVPTDLNRRMGAGELDISVVSAVEYARDSERYLLLPDLAISCDGPVRSVMLFSRRPAAELGSRSVIVSRSSMTSVALLELLFENVWHARPRFVAGDSREAAVEASVSRADLPHRLQLEALAGEGDRRLHDDVVDRHPFDESVEVSRVARHALRGRGEAFVEERVVALVGVGPDLRKQFLQILGFGANDLAPPSVEELEE